jgi:hypothetical protein
VVTLLLAVVALAARGHPLGSSGGSGGGVPASFWDYAFTTFLILVGAWAALGILAGHLRFGGPRTERSYQGRTTRALVVLIVFATLLVFVARYVDLNRLLHPHNNRTTPTLPRPGSKARDGLLGSKRTSRHVHFQWDELAIVLAVLGLGVLAVTRPRLGDATGLRPAPEVLAAALDESLDDLRSDPDLRRAIVAAYARMETALAAAGIPRQPAEAPFEYVERALLSLDTSADAVRRLTDLFEWARFSHHEPDPSMRDEAVDALVAVRDELRASELAPA